jgi:glycosyltransferase involved in cell wall biosynthesis
MMRRILYVDHADLMGGAEHSLLLLMTGLPRQRYMPLLACNADSPVAEAASAAGVAVERLPLGRLRGRRDLAGVARTWGRGVAALRDLIRREDIAAVHSNVMRASLYAAPAARLAGVPLIWHVRDIHRERLYLAVLSLLARRIIAISTAVARPLPAWGRRKTTVIPNGVALDEFRFDAGAREAIRAEWGAGPHEIVVGCVGWLAPWKQVELFIEMAGRLADAMPQLRFIVAGAAAHPSYADYVAGLQARAAALPAGRCQFIGARSDMPRVLAGLDILAHTARSEPFGRVLIEAMAMSRPVVAFADGGVPEIVVDGQTGRLVAPGDAAGLAAVVAELAGRPDLRRQMGEAGRRRALAEFSAEAMVNRVVAVYDAIFEG